VRRISFFPPPPPPPPPPPFPARWRVFFPFLYTTSSPNGTCSLPLEVLGSPSLLGIEPPSLFYPPPLLFSLLLLPWGTIKKLCPPRASPLVRKRPFSFLSPSLFYSNRTISSPPLAGGVLDPSAPKKTFPPLFFFGPIAPVALFLFQDTASLVASRAFLSLSLGASCSPGPVGNR